MNRREYLKAMDFGLAALALPGYAIIPNSLAGNRPPNIVLNVSADQDYNDLGCYGGSENVPVPACSVCDEFLSSMEIFPMICKAAGAKVPKDVVLDGSDMASVLAGRQKSSRKEMFWQSRGDKAA